MPPDTLRELRAGAVAVLPAAVAVVPFGLLFGALAAQKGLAPVEVMLMSATVFAGASQFVALDIWAEPAPWLLLTLTALMINSRHVLMGASLTPKLGCLSGRGSLLALFFLADEVWALAEGRARRHALSLAFLLGVGATLWLNWVWTTGLGAGLGMIVEDPGALGFDFAFTAIFIGLLVGLWRGPRSGLPVAVSAVVAVVVHLAVEGPWYIAAGGLASAVTGALGASPEA